MAIFEQIAAMPATTCIILLNSVLWFRAWNARLPFDAVSTSYEAVILRKEYWRVFTAAFSHLDIMHLVFNMASLWSCGQMEALFGSVFYLRTTLLLLFLSSAISNAIFHFLIFRIGQRNYATRQAVGYSCVVFGWMTIMAQLQPSMDIPLPFGISLPVSFAPFMSLFITQLIVRRASFLGHLSGIFAGLLIAWGMFQWVSPYWLLTSMIHVVLAVLVSLKRTTTLSLPWVQVGREPGELDDADRRDERGGAAAGAGAGGVPDDGGLAAALAASVAEAAGGGSGAGSGGAAGGSGAAGAGRTGARGAGDGSTVSGGEPRAGDWV